MDGAIFKEIDKSGMGCILRDDHGKVLMAANKLEHGVEDPEAIELTAIFQGLQLCASMGIANIQVESD